MRKSKPICYKCSKTHNVKLFMSSDNKAQLPMKTFYCIECARNHLPGQRPIQNLSNNVIDLKDSPWYSLIQKK